MALTDSWLKAHHKKPHEKTLEKADGEGLSARVSPAGKVVFQMRYRAGGKPTRLDLGTYPRLSLKEVRVEHQRLKAELEQGQDPKMVKQLELAGIADAHTNESLYRAWHESYCLGNKLQAGEILRSFEIHIFPAIGMLPADRTPTNAWLTLIERIADKTPSIAERLLDNTKQLHKWANRRGLMQTKPLSDVSARGDLMIERSESGRSLSDDEVRLVWHSIDRSRLAPGNKLFIKLCLFFGCRNGELRGMDPTVDLDLEAMTWTIPPEKNKVRRKVRRSIIRPLIPEILPYIEEARKLSNSKHLLFTQDKGPGALETNGVLSMPYSVRRNAKSHFGVDMQHWSMHDLRKTARTNFSSLTGVHVAEVMLGHSLKGMQGVYDRHLYLEEQSAAYSAWWQRLMAITEVAPA
jgi:integrase